MLSYKIAKLESSYISIQMSVHVMYLKKKSNSHLFIVALNLYDWLHNSSEHKYRIMVDKFLLISGSYFEFLHKCKILYTGSYISYLITLTIKAVYFKTLCHSPNWSEGSLCLNLVFVNKTYASEALQQCPFHTPWRQNQPISRNMILLVKQLRWAFWHTKVDQNAVELCSRDGGWYL